MCTSRREALGCPSRAPGTRPVSARLTPPRCRVGKGEASALWGRTAAGHRLPPSGHSQASFSLCRARGLPSVGSDFSRARAVVELERDQWQIRAPSLPGCGCWDLLSSQGQWSLVVGLPCPETPTTRRPPCESVAASPPRSGTPWPRGCRAPVPPALGRSFHCGIFSLLWLH